MFPQYIRVAKQLRNPNNGGHHLMPTDKRVQSRCQVRFGREASSNSQGETDLGPAAQHASRRGQSHIVDLRVRAPHTTSCDRDLEFAWKVVEIPVPRQHSRGFERDGRSVANLVRVHSSDRAAGHIARDIAAGAGRVQSNLRERFEQIWKRLDRDPVQLNVLAHCDVGDSVSVAAGELGNGPQLFRTEQTVGDPDSHHEALQRPAFSALAAGNARPIALRIHAPPAKIGPQPLRWNGPEPLTGEAPDFFQAFPWILGAFETLDSLCLGFLRCVCHRLFRPRLICPCLCSPQIKNPPPD